MYFPQKSDMSGTIPLMNELFQLSVYTDQETWQRTDNTGGIKLIVITQTSSQIPFVDSKINKAVKGSDHTFCKCNSTTDTKCITEHVVECDNLIYTKSQYAASSLKNKNIVPGFVQRTIVVQLISVVLLRVTPRHYQIG